MAGKALVTALTPEERTLTEFRDSCVQGGVGGIHGGHINTSPPASERWQDKDPTLRGVHGEPCDAVDWGFGSCAGGLDVASCGSEGEWGGGRGAFRLEETGLQVSVIFPFLKRPRNY